MLYAIEFQCGVEKKIRYYKAGTNIEDDIRKAMFFTSHGMAGVQIKRCTRKAMFRYWSVTRVRIVEVEVEVEVEVRDSITVNPDGLQIPF